MNKFLEAVKDINTCLIICSIPFDGDCISSGLIVKKYLQSLNKTVRIIYPTKIKDTDKKYYGFLPYFDEIEAADTRVVLKENGFDLVIFVDGGGLNQFYDTSESFSNPPDINRFPKRIHIDHHPLTSDNLGTIRFQKTDISSTTELVLAEIIPDSFISQNMATLGYAGIMGDTGGFLWNFYPSTFRITAILLEKGADTDSVRDKMFFSKSQDDFKLISYTIQNTIYDNVLKSCFLFLDYKKIRDDNLTKERLGFIKRYFKDEVAKSTIGFDRGFIIYEQKKGRIDISARGSGSRNQLDLPKLLTGIGGIGGGHFQACGVTFEQANLEEIKNKLLQALKAQLSK